MDNKDMYSTKLVRARDIVEGEVIALKPRMINVDLGTFTEGTMYLEYYTLDKSINSFEEAGVKIGDKIKCQVVKVDENEILLSRLNMAKAEAFSTFASEHKEDYLSVKVERKVNKGFIVNSNGVELFLPERDSDGVKVGDKFMTKILELDSERCSGVVSKRAYDREVYQTQKADELAKFSVGDIVNGEIVKIEPYGAFVKLGINNGLIRLKELDHKYISDASTVVKVGDKVEVKIIGIKDGKIDLSRKAMFKSPFDLYCEEHKVSDKITAKVIQKLPFGAVFALADEVNGLLHKSEFSWNPNDNLLNNIKLGDELELAIIAIDQNKNKISLSRKALIDNPWGRVDAKEGDIVSCKVVEITPKGLKIETLGVDGFIPTSELVFDKKSSKAEDYYSIGDEIKATIIEINTRAWVLTASVKKYQNKLEREQFDDYMTKQNEEEKKTTIGDIFTDVLKK